MTKKLTLEDILFNLTNSEKYQALELAGVDNWEGYDIAREIVEEESLEWSDLNDEERYSFLEEAGVDNWSYYSDTLLDFAQDKLKELSEED